MPTDDLTDRDRALWAAVARTVTPLGGPRPPQAGVEATAIPNPLPASTVPSRPRPSVAASRPPARPPAPAQLDGSWERRLARGLVEPDRTLDLHGLRLDAAWERLDGAVGAVVAGGGRVLLVIAGRDRGPDVRGQPGARGRIRAKLADWLNAGVHARRVLAIRPAHARHGGAGAVYVVLKRADR